MDDSDDSDIFEKEGTDIITATNKEDKTMSSTPNNDTLLNELKITVSDPEKKTKMSGLKIQETFISYLIEATPKESNKATGSDVTSSWRRYSEFELLRNYLIAVYPAVVVPPLPEKRANYIWRKLASVDALDLDFLEKRRVGLESFIHRVASHHKMGKDKMLHYFITKEEGWKEAVVASDFQAKSDSWLKKMNASLRVKQPDIRFEQLKCYANNLQTSLSNLLKVRAKVAERIYGIYKIHNNYCRVFKEWALIEPKPLRDALQMSSLQMDLFAKSIDNLIDEEDQLAEQLKEYLYFSDAIKLVCQKHQALQYEVEWTEQQLATALSERKQLQAGEAKTFSFTGMKARLLGIDAAEQREGRIEQLERDVSAFQVDLEKARATSKQFLDAALAEVALFRARKRVDLREIFTGYAILHIKMHREGAALWQRFKAPFDEIARE